MHIGMCSVDYLMEVLVLGDISPCHPWARPRFACHSGKEKGWGCPALNTSGRLPGAQTSTDWPRVRPRLMLSNIFKLRLAHYEWPGQSAVVLWAGPVELAVRGLSLNKPNLSAVPENIPTFIYHFLMRLKQTNTNQGFKDSSSNLPL